MAASDLTDMSVVKLPDELFGANGNRNNNRILPPNGSILDLSFLRAALKPSGDEPFEEKFLPKSVFIREEMETAVKELLRNGSKATVFSGSPGIGKSVLTFLVSKFAMKRLTLADGSTSYSSIEIRFTRDSSRSGNIAREYEQLRGSFTADGVKWTNASIVAEFDGPKSGALTNYSMFSYGCTSGAGI
jgi:hypothetical protein